MPREHWFSQKAGFSVSLTNILRDFFGSTITAEIDQKIRQGITTNNFWLIPCASVTTPEDVRKVYRLVYDIIETCRLYGTSVAVFPSTGINLLANTKHPWIDTGTYFEALVGADLAVIEGLYPDPVSQPRDWSTLQSALAQRVTKPNKPTLCLDRQFSQLPVIAAAKRLSLVGGNSDATV